MEILRHRAIQNHKNPNFENVDLDHCLVDPYTSKVALKIYKSCKFLMNVLLTKIASILLLFRLRIFRIVTNLT